MNKRLILILSVSTFSILLPITSAAQDLTQEAVEESVNPKPWSQAPSDFRGIQFGASVAEAMKALGEMKCQPADRAYWPSGTSHCTTRDKRMAFKVDDLMLPTRYVFHQNRFVSVEMGPYYVTVRGLAALEQRKPRFETLNTAFVEKYGAPSRTRRVRYRGMEEVPRSQSAGSEFVPAQFSEEVHVWENDAVRIEIARWRDESINRASIETTEWYRMKKAFDEARTKGSVTNF